MSGATNQRSSPIFSDATKVAMTRQVCNYLATKKTKSTALWLKQMLIQYWLTSLVLLSSMQRRMFTPYDWDKSWCCLGHLPMQVVQKTFKITTQLANGDINLPLRQHYKSRFPQASVNRLHEIFSTDASFVLGKAFGGAKMCQLWWAPPKFCTVWLENQADSEICSPLSESMVLLMESSKTALRCRSQSLGGSIKRDISSRNICLSLMTNIRTRLNTGFR